MKIKDYLEEGIGRENYNIDRKLVAKVSKSVEWDYYHLAAFFEAVMEDCNFSSEAKKVIPFMEKQF